MKKTVVITILQKHYDFCRNNSINISDFVRRKIDRRMMKESRRSKKNEEIRTQQWFCSVW